MKLCYHKGNNFGDAINPLIMNYYFPNFFDDNTEKIFLGIGSILGLKKGFPDTKKIIVFTSGYAAGAQNTYGKPPVIDSKYDIYSVRGPLTAKYLDIDKSLGIADGAILIRNIISPCTQKEYKFSYMPHVGSEQMFNWEKFIKELGINYISPKGEVEKIIKKIQRTEILITEAMHGAIVADSLRVPWIPVRCYNGINKFKWEDYCTSMELNYNPTEINRLYKKEYFHKLFSNKTGIQNDFIINNLHRLYVNISKSLARKKIIKLKNSNPILSKEEVLMKKNNYLLKIISRIKKKYI